MKRTLLAALLSCLAITAAKADLIWYEGFNYADGSLTNNSAGLWAVHSGSDDALVKNNKLELAGTSTPGASRTGDVNRKFCLTDCTYTNGAQLIYASFTINSTNFPSTTAGYFAHLASGPTTFQCKVFSVKGTNNLANTWQLGVSATANTPSVIFPTDLATNVDYQVVIEWDPVNLFAVSLWINPLSYADVRVISSDAVTPIVANSFDFRQAANTANWFCTISNVAVATTFEEAATNVWSTNAVSPVIVYQPQNATNFTGDSFAVSGLAAGQGLAGLTYDWYRNGALFPNPNGNTNVLAFPAGAASDSGSYKLVATTPYGLSVTSVTANLWITNPPVPPTITVQPTNTTVFFGQTAVLRVGATGVQPFTYQWFFTNGTPVSGANYSGETTANLSISNVQTNNGTTTGYYVEVSNPFGPRRSATSVISAVSAPIKTIGELRTMVDSTFFLPTNTTAVYTTTGIVTSYTNVTTAANSSFYLQDATGGILVFFANNTQARPEAGDSVTVTGPLGQFNSVLELNLTAADSAHSVVTNSHGNPLPAPIVLPFSFTNSPSASNAIRFYQGALVTLTNVYFPTGFTGTNNFPSGANVVVTNAAGETFAFRVDARIGDIIGRRVPPYGWTVTGNMGFFLGATAADRSAGFQLTPTRFEDIVSQKPAGMTVIGGQPAVTWPAGPRVPYSVWRADDLFGTYNEIATGLTFPDANGVYTDLSAPAGNAYYKLTSP